MAYIQQSHYFEKFDDSFFESLQVFNVRHVEQLASLLLSPTGEQALRRLKLPVKISEIRDATKRYLQQADIPGLQISSASHKDPTRPANKLINLGLGYRTANEGTRYLLEYLSSVPETVYNIANSNSVPEDRLLTFLNDFPLRKSNPTDSANIIYDIESLPQVKDQGSRGTCVAFATSAMLSAFIDIHIQNFSRSTDFSEQYLYYRAKSGDPSRVEGTHFEYALQALQEHGICSQYHLPYKDYNDWGQELLFATNKYNKASLTELAKGTKISGYIHLPYSSDIVDNIKSCLERGIAVGIGVVVFQDAWFNNDYAAMKGEIELPIVVRDDEGKEVLLDIPRGGHAVTIYGYEERATSDVAASRPGGGGFIFRNSWGTNWAYNNTEYARGYGIIPYDYIRKYCLDACIITGLQSDKIKKGKGS